LLEFNSELHVGANGSAILDESRRQRRSKTKRYTLETNCSFVWEMTNIVSFRPPLVTGFTGEKLRPLYNGILSTVTVVNKTTYRSPFLIIWRVDNRWRNPTLEYRWLAEVLVTASAIRCLSMTSQLFIISTWRSSNELRKTKKRWRWPFFTTSLWPGRINLVQNLSCSCSLLSKYYCASWAFKTF